MGLNGWVMKGGRDRVRICGAGADEVGGDSRGKDMCSFNRPREMTAGSAGNVPRSQEQATLDEKFCIAIVDEGPQAPKTPCRIQSFLINTIGIFKVISQFGFPRTLIPKLIFVPLFDPPASSWWVNFLNAFKEL